MSLLHEQYDIGGDLVVFQCTECGHAELSLGSLHAHVETHRGYTRFNIQVPLTGSAMADFDALMDYTQVLLVEETSEVPLEEVEEL